MQIEEVGGCIMKEVLVKLINDFEKTGRDYMHFNTWDYNISVYDDRDLARKGYELVYQGFNSHDCCSQFTIKKM